MRKRFVRGYASASLALVAAGSLASCSAGVDAGTLDPQRLSGSHADLAQIKVRNAFILAPEEEGDDAELYMTIVNDGTGDDALTDVSLDGAEGDVGVELEPSSVDLPRETPTIFPGDTTATITVDGDALTPGTYVTATFGFETAGTLAMRMLVLSEAGVYGGN